MPSLVMENCESRRMPNVLPRSFSWRARLRCASISCFLRSAGGRARTADSSSSDMIAVWPVRRRTLSKCERDAPSMSERNFCFFSFSLTNWPVSYSYSLRSPSASWPKPFRMATSSEWMSAR